MFGSRLDRRKLLATGAMALLGACAVIPKGPTEAPPPAPAPAPAPSPTTLPTDNERHRVALLVPLSGSNAAVGQSLANAATMAVLDTNAQNLRVTTYDTAINPADAARRAVADGNKLILGPLLSSDVPEVVKAARPANVPMISFSNDETAAQRDVFIMGNLPGQSVARTIDYAIGTGIRAFGALVPRGEYGQRASDALMASVRQGGGSVVAMEAYDRSGASVTSAARRLAEKGGYDAVLIADGGSMSARAAPVLKGTGNAGPRLLGTELWSGEKDVTSSPALRGAWYAAVSDRNFGQFTKSYRSRFGSQPYRIATLGYDAVLLSLRVAKNWKPGTDFPMRNLVDPDGFLGLDGPFRFGRDGVIERAFEVREVTAGGNTVISPAPAKFGR
ncbi:penicillin-binding protein activator [Novosphingobium aquimarinum]|uniref:penicillin-binding protein activator n=1 Tax=Novosphingobium aquimarinum TaxID=2682494 RepID=UPI0012EBB692|nr:penicillin-binding protein activator [Novosphingobium aquimarinum]